MKKKIFFGRKIYSQEKINSIKSKIDIVEIVAKDISLKKVGKNFFGCCPFCNGSKSMSISQSNQFGYCFNCGESFDVIGYYQKVKKLSFTEAMRVIKVQINLNDALSFKKLQRAIAWLFEITEDNQNVFLDVSERRLLIDFIGWLSFMLGDYYSLAMNKAVSKDQLNQYIKLFSIMKTRFNGYAKGRQIQNFFSFLLNICNLIKNNNYNLGGLIYIIQ